MSTSFQMPNISEQVAIAGQASRAREARDNKVFVNSLFKEIESLKADNKVIKEMMLQVLDKLGDQKKVKSTKVEKAE